MNHLLKLALVLLLILAGIWSYQKLFPSEEQIIDSRLRKLAETVSFDSQSSALTGLGQARTFAAYFSTDAQIHVHVQNRQRVLQGRERLQQAMLAARSRLAQLSLELYDLQIKVDTATHTATAHFTAVAESAGNENLTVQEVRAHLEKIEGEWLITEVVPIKTLR